MASRRSESRSQACRCIRSSTFPASRPHRPRAPRSGSTPKNSPSFLTPAGKDEALKHEAETVAAEARFPVKVIGYSDEVEKLMRAANVMISKLGGLSTFEALASGVPIIADATTEP